MCDGEASRTDAIHSIEFKARLILMTEFRARVMKDYRINIFYSPEDTAYIADIPDLKYCSAIGDTPQEALQEVLIAKQAWLEASQIAGKTFPEPI